MARNLKSLMSHLNPETRGALESAAGICLSQSHYEVEIEHYLLKLLELTDSDLHHILQHFGISTNRVLKALSRTIDGFKTGNGRNPVLSQNLINWVEKSWMSASIDFGVSEIRSGHFLYTLLTERGLMRVNPELARALKELTADILMADFDAITQNSPETSDEIHTSASGHTDGPERSGTNLQKYTVDLTQEASDGRIDGIVGRDQEIRQMVDILMRRRQNNPILTGEPGVGKTAVVEGLACRVAKGDVPPPLVGVRILSLDMALLQAGAGVKGEFENRLKGVISEVKSSPSPIILFIDEAHSLVGAGGSAGQGDAANLLKPALARGELRTIAATTWSEYKRYFEKDAALTRRFQVVKVEEPTEELATVMMRNLANRLEKHHGVRILDQAVADAVKLSSRYLPDRQLPDKSVSVLDTACARVAVSQCATPASIEDHQVRISYLEKEERLLEREIQSGIDHGQRLQDIKRAKADLHEALIALMQRWQAEENLVKDAQSLQIQLDELNLQSPEIPDLRERLQGLYAELEDVQGDSPLVFPLVDSTAIASVIGNWTGIPVGKMLSDEIKTLQQLDRRMKEMVVGQDQALESLAERIRTSRAGLQDPKKPRGVFLLVGPSGVGKTETAVTIANLLYGGERNLITINMSEYQEAHTVSSLKGSPPGYVGYGEGGVLTEAVRRKPYSVVLLDEIEKAHNDVMELFYQVLDKGQMEDGEGRLIDFKNTIILLTSNLATDSIMAATRNSESLPDLSDLLATIRPELSAHLKPALLGRMTVLPYYPLNDAALTGIARLKLQKIIDRLAKEQSITLAFDEAVITQIVSRCTEVDSGARNIDNIISGNLLPQLSNLILAAMAEGQALETIDVTLDEGGQFRVDCTHRDA